MIGNGSWIWIVIIVAAIVIYYLYRRGKIPWLKGIKMPRIPKVFEPKSASLTEKLKMQTEKEIVKAEELRSVLEAKTELAKARAANIRLQREIDGVSERSVEREKQVAEKVKLEAQKAKQRRL